MKCTQSKQFFLLFNLKSPYGTKVMCKRAMGAMRASIKSCMAIIFRVHFSHCKLKQHVAMAKTEEVCRGETYRWLQTRLFIKE